jgi:hypothetical protein
LHDVLNGGRTLTTLHWIAVGLIAFGWFSLGGILRRSRWWIYGAGLMVAAASCVFLRM